MSVLVGACLDVGTHRLKHSRMLNKRKEVKKMCYLKCVKCGGVVDEVAPFENGALIVSESAYKRLCDECVNINMARVGIEYIPKRELTTRKRKSPKFATTTGLFTKKQNLITSLA